MKPNRRRRSSEEVIIEIKDSEPRGKNYWNLRGEKSYNYSRKNSSEGLRDELNIEFNMDENRHLTQEQKQVILNTLIAENEEAEDKDSGRPDFSRGLLPLLIPLTLLALIASFVALTGSC